MSKDVQNLFSTTVYNYIVSPIVLSVLIFWTILLRQWLINSKWEVHQNPKHNNDNNNNKETELFILWNDTPSPAASPQSADWTQCWLFSPTHIDTFVRLPYTLMRVSEHFLCDRIIGLHELCITIKILSDCQTLNKKKNIQRNEKRK